MFEMVFMQTTKNEPFPLSHLLIAQLTVLFPILLIPLQVHPYPFFQTVCLWWSILIPMSPILLLYFSFQSLQIFPSSKDVPQLGCQIAHNPQGWSRWVGLSTRSTRTEPEYQREEKELPPSPQVPSAPQGRSAVTRREGC